MKLSLYISTLSKTQLQSEGISLPSPKAYDVNDNDMEVWWRIRKEHITNDIKNPPTKSGDFLLININHLNFWYSYLYITIYQIYKGVLWHGGNKCCVCGGMVDALALGASVKRRGGSSPFKRTQKSLKCENNGCELEEPESTKGSRRYTPTTWQVYKTIRRAADKRW